MRRNSWGQFVSARRNPKSAVPWRKVGQGSWQAKTAKGTIGVTFSYASGGYYGSTPSEDGPILKTRLAASRWAENAVGVSRSVRKNSYSTSGSKYVETVHAEWNHSAGYWEMITYSAKGKIENIRRGPSDPKSTRATLQAWLRRKRDWGGPELVLGSVNTHAPRDYASTSRRKNSYSTSGSSTKRRNGARSMADIKAANTAAGHHWFSKATMAFFNSRVVAGPFEGDTFVTSERGPHQNRPLFSVRRAKPDGGIETVGEFQGYSSKAAAVAAAKGLRKNGRRR